MLTRLAISMLFASASLAAPITPVPYTAVRFEGEFWGQRLEVVRTATLDANRHQCDITGRLANFDRAAGTNKTPYEGYLFNDSDVYKAIEGWTYIIATETDATRRADLDTQLDQLIARIAAAQRPDGYIDTYYTTKEGLEKRWTREQHDHETYCMGHLIEAGVAHFQATGKRSLLDIAIKAADHIATVFGAGKLEEPSGHEEIEIALIKLSEVTGEGKYLELAQWFIEQRGKERLDATHTLAKPWGEYCQDHVPLRQQMEAAGHAVRAGYLYCAVSDLARLKHDDGYAHTVDTLWEDVTNRRMYLTGGIGPSAHNEGFTTPYDLPTATAYQETCASIALALWAERMFLLHGDSKYMDAFEQTTYNAVLAGLSLDGRKFFYVNPLASNGKHHRQDWFGCACCPPNVLRYLGSLGGAFYAVSGNDVYLNQFAQSDATIKTADGKVSIKQVTTYPWDGALRIEYKQIEGPSGILKIRRPAWCNTFTLKINGATAAAKVGADGYLNLTPGPQAAIELNFEMPVRRVYSNTRVKASLGHVALARGPLIYAFEWDAKAQSLGRCILTDNAGIKTSRRNYSGAACTALEVELTRMSAVEGQPLYSSPQHNGTETAEAIPYFMWCNRGTRSMQVWTPESPQALPPAPAAGLTVTASHVAPWETLDAVSDNILPASSSDDTVPRMTCWDHKGTREWIVYEFDRPRDISGCDVYWFDDTGIGGCRIPASWSLEYKDGGAWKPVAGAEALAAHLNQFDTCAFKPVKATAVRLNMQFQKDYSGGVMEWRVR